MTPRLAVAFAAVLAACAAAPPTLPRGSGTFVAASGTTTRPHAGGTSTGLEFDVEPTAAEVLVDGAPRGTIAEIVAAGGVLALPPGIYQVSLSATGRVTWRAEVAVRSGRERIEVKLQAKPIVRP